MEHDLVVEGRVVTPGGVVDGQVGIDGGRISNVGKQGLKGARWIRAGSCFVFPGFVDPHVHLREPGWEHKEDFATGTAAAIHGGVTTVFDMPNNPIPTQTQEAVRAKAELAKEKALADVRLFGGVDASRLDLIAGIAEKVVGFKLYLARTTGAPPFARGLLGSALRSIAAVGRPASIHCEDQSMVDAKAKELSGDLRPDAHCDVRPPEAEEAAVREVVERARSVGSASLNVCHASTGRTIELVAQARVEGLRLVCEATLHHLYFNRGACLSDPMLRTNPPLRSEGDRASVLEGLRSGAVSFLVTDHAPHTREEKLTGQMSGVPGLDDYSHLVAWLLKDQGFEPSRIAEVCSANQSSFFGLSDRGRIEEGTRADLCILDMRSPEKVSADDLMTKCGWSPYEGRSFPGRARWTVVKGEVLLDDFVIAERH